MTVDPSGSRTVLGVLGYYDSWLALRQRYLRVPGVQAAVLVDGEVALSTAYGVADLATGAPLTSAHLFHVASHSKTFTATVVHQLAETGRLRLDDPVGRWLPDLEGSAVAKVSLRALLCHGGGVVRDGRDGDFWALHRAFPDAAALLALARDEGAVLPADERFKYSNIGYSLLGLVIEAVTGRAYAEVVREQVVDRLGLTRTAPDHDPHLGPYAAGHSALAYAESRVAVEHVATGAMAPATGFVSTAEDLVRYAAAHLPGDERLLGADAKRQMQRTEWRVDGPGGVAEPLAEYALGLQVSRVGSRRLLGHGGGWPGHITRTLLDAESGVAVSVLTNAIDGPAEALANALFRFADLAADRDAPRSSGDPSRFTGRFANVWGVHDVADLGGRLLWLDPASDDPWTAPMDLVVEGEDRLRFCGGNGYGSHGESLEYVRTDGRVTAVRGSSGMTWHPIETVTSAAGRGEPVRLGAPLVG